MWYEKLNPNGVTDVLDDIRRCRFDEEQAGNDRSKEWHPSSFAHMCERREAIHQILGLSNTFEDATLKIFELGHSLHRLYQDEYFGPNYLWGKWLCSCKKVHWGFKPDACSLCGLGSECLKYEEVEIGLIYPGLEKPIKGHIDLILQINNKWYLLDLKSIHPYAFSSMQKGEPEVKINHKKQAAIYTYAINGQHIVGIPPHIDVPKIDYYGVLYVDKGSGNEQVFLYENDEKLDILATTEIARCIKVEESLRNKKIPARCSDCKIVRPQSKRMADCKYKDICKLEGLSYALVKQLKK